MRRDKLFGNKFMRFAACALMAFACAGEVWGIGNTISKPRLNPAFVKWQHEQKNQRPQANKSSVTNVQKRTTRLLASTPEADTDLLPLPEGLVPTMIDFSYLNSLNSMNFGSVSDALLPSHDPRPLTPVRHQDPKDADIKTCWAQASVGSIETWLLSNGHGKNQFSVRNVVNLSGWDTDNNFHTGGHHIRSSAYFLRWGGPVWEADDPYTNRYGIVDESVSAMLGPVYHVQQTRLVPARTGALDNDSLKRAILEFGGLYATMQLYSPYYRGTSELVRYWSNTGAYYCPEKGAGHAVTLVGWDDNYSKDNFNPVCRPKGNGAWIVKDSYGVDLPRDNGYIYVSYYDTTFAYTESCAFPLIESKDNYGEIYQYDELGQVTAWGIPANSTQIYTSGYGANMFTAKKAEELAAVGFYATAPKAAYKIRIYTGCNASKPSSGTLALEQSGTVDDYAGFYTQPLKNTVAVTKGQRFSVVVMLSTPGAAPFSLEIAVDGYTSNASANAGESFFSTNGVDWHDFTLNANLTHGIPANFCLKAYTKAVTPIKPTLLSIAVQPEDDKTMSLKPGDKVQMKCEATYSNNAKSNVTDVAQWSLTSGRSYATLSSGGLLTAKNVPVFEPQTITVQAIYTEDGIVATNRYGFSMAETPPEAPTDVTASQGTDASCIHVNWTAPAGATEYAVYRAAANNVKNAYHLENVNVAKYHDTGSVKPIVPGIDYWYFIKAKNSSGTSGFSTGALGWRKLSPPDAETIKASDNLTDRVTISWGEVEGATHYRVYRADDVDGEKQAISGWLIERTFDDVPPEAGVPYYYFVVAAVDSSGSRPSDFSNPVQGMMPLPVTVDHLEIKGDASIASGGYADYTADVIYTDKHRVENVSPVTLTVSGDGATVSGNRVTAATVTENKKVTLKASYTENGKIARGEKEITIAAVKPNTPTGVIAGLVSQGVTITWNAVSGAVSYKVYRADSANAIATQIGMTAGTSYPDTSAMPGVAYTYSVSAVNGAGESERSGGVVVTVPLAAPTGVTATSDRTDGVNVKWSAVNGATHYRVARATSPTGAKTQLGWWQTGTAYPDASATAGTTYYYFVRAATSSGGANASEYSSPAAPGRVIPSRTILSVEISGMDKVPASKSAVYTCVATYNDETTETVTPTWSVSPTSAATISENGLLMAKAVSANCEVTVAASFTDGTTKTANKAVTIVAPEKATAEIENMVVSMRWPFAPIVDIDYILVVNPASAKAIVGVVGHDEDHGIDMAATTLSGDGADGSYIAAGAHRLTWNIGADYPNFHAKAFSVSMTAAPSMIGVPENITASESTSGVRLNWNAVEDANGYEVWRGTEPTTNGAERIATVTGATTYFDSTGVAGTTYRYWLRASGEDGVGEFAQPITGTRVVVVPVSLEISEPSSVTAGGTATYTCTVTRNDNTSESVTPTWSITSGSSYASIDSFGVMTANGTAEQRSVTIQASYTQNGTTVTATKTVTINTKSVTISFDGNGGMPSVSSQSYTAYGTYDSLPSPTRDGYAFAGWFTDSSGGTQVTTSSTVPSSNTTLYAHWTAVTYFISFDANGGTGTMSTQSVVVGTGTTLQANAFSRQGYTFVGWATDVSGNVVYADCANVGSLSSEPGMTVTLYAVWLGTPSSVNASDATSSSEVTVTWSSAINATYYQVWRGTTSSTGSATLISSGVTSTSYSDTTVPVGTNYYYWVKAGCGSTVSSFSGYDVGRRRIAAPTGVTVATDSSGTNFVVSWSGAVSGAVKYEIWRATYKQKPGGTVSSSSTLSRIATVDAIISASGGGTSSSGLNVIITHPAQPRTSYTDYPSDNLTVLDRAQGYQAFYRYVVKAVGATDTSALSNYSEIRTYKNAGTYSLSLPSTANYSIAAVGGGGGGAQCAHSSLIGFNIAGGGSGAYYKGVLNLAKGSYVVNVGNAGAASVANSSFSAVGGNGGNTRLTNSAGTVYYISAGGGGGGNVSGTSAIGGSGGTVSIGSSTTVVSMSSNVSGKVGDAKRQVAISSANGGASVYGGYGVGGNNVSDGGVGFFQIVINE